MDAAYTTRAMPPLPPVRADLTPQKQSVTTDLPQEKSVGMARESQPAQTTLGDTRNQRAAMPGVTERLLSENRRQVAREVKVEIDEATSDLVYQTVDSDTGDVLSQFPNETLMKIRAYVREEVETPPLSTHPEAETPHVERFV